MAGGSISETFEASVAREENGLGNRLPSFLPFPNVDDIFKSQAELRVHIGGKCD